MIEITGIKLLIGLVVVGLIISGIILLVRRQLMQQGLRKLSEGKDLNHPTFIKQYPEVNVFKFVPMMLRFGLATSLVLCLFAFNWTTYEREEYVVTGCDLPIELLTTPPITYPEPPPPPPPPPPPVIEEVEPEEEVEDIEFEDTTVEEETAVEAPPPPPPPPKKGTIVVKAPPPMEIEEEKVDNEIRIFVQEMPRFPGCEDNGFINQETKRCAEQKMMEFVYKNIKYPTIAREIDIQGMAVVSFVIEKDGSVSNATIMRDLEGGCGKEALRVVNEMPKWVPGKQNGRPVRVQFNLPVRFKLSG